MKSNKDSDPDPAGGNSSSQRKHLKISGSLKQSGFGLKVGQDFDDKDFELLYPGEIWRNFPEENRKQLLDNLAFAFTVHLPLLKDEDLDLKYDTAQPIVGSFIYNLFLKQLPVYRHLYKGEVDVEVKPVLRRLLDSNITFGPFNTEGFPDFAETKEERIVIPFTFGKDSLLTYCIAKEIGLNPLLVCFYEPTEQYSKDPKLKLIEQFEKEFGEKVHFVDNGFANMRDEGEGWFGWEGTLTTYALMALPFAYHSGARYIVFSNEISCNDYFYDHEKFRVIVDYEQSDLATNDLSCLIGAMSKGKVGCMNFLQGINELAIVAILKNKYEKYLKYLMSCWADHETASECRWCQNCSKCARLFLYLVANGIDPAFVGFSDDLFKEKYLPFFKILGGGDRALGYDLLGTNRDENLLAFYLAYMRGANGDAIERFLSLGLKEEAEERLSELVDKYYGFVDNHMIPKFYRDAVHDLLKDSLFRILPTVKTSYEKREKNDSVFV